MTSPQRPRRFLCYPGAASHIITELGFDAGVREYVDPAGYAGTSAGGAVAIAGAFGVPVKKTRAVLKHLLQDDRVLDINPFSASDLDGDMGLCAWEVVPAAVDDLIGKGVRLGDSPIPLVLGTTDLDSGLPLYFDSRVEGHKRILVRDIARPMTSIPFLGPQLTIPSWMVGTLTPSVQLQTDGGVSDNTVDHVFDDQREPRVAVRLVPHRAQVHRVYKHQKIKQALAVFRAMLTAAGRIKSVRGDGAVIDIPAIGDGFDFSLTEQQIDERYSMGYATAIAARPKVLATGVLS